jgi:hypothetical protein
MTRSLSALMLCTAGMFCAAGCHGSRYTIFQPGTVQQQQLRATVHDPYTDVDAGPEVVGGRPRDYSQPLPEPVRNRIYADSWWGR